MKDKDAKFLGVLMNSAYDIFITMAAFALEYGDFRGGAAIGFVDSDGQIWSVSSETNGYHPSRWSKLDDRYACYDRLKLQTDVSQKSDTKKLPKKELPLKAVHEGAIVFFLEQYGVWVGIAYSGHEGSQDKNISSYTRDKIFLSSD